MVMVVLHALIVVLDEVFHQVIMEILNVIIVAMNFGDMVMADSVWERFRHVLSVADFAVKFNTNVWFVADDF